MTGMFSDVNLSLSNYDALLIGWSALSLQPNVPFDAGFSQYCAGATERQSMIDTYNWIITDNGYTNSCLSDQFVTTWKTDNTGYSGPTSINITTHPSESYNYDVDWNNDGIFEDLNVTGDIQHNYGVAGTYTIRIRGTYPRIFFSTPFADYEKILSVDQWGSTAWTSMNLAFEYCSNLQILASDTPNLSVATDLSFMFQYCTSMNENIDVWDVSNITNMKAMFFDADSFNQPLNSWDVSNVNNMENMFRLAESFNQPLNNWNVGNVTNMKQMFFSAINFNQALNSWNVSNVNNMEQMFSGAENFNQALNNWNVASVQNMFSMFAFASDFDQNLGNWNVASVTNMTSMFSNATLSTANYDALIIGWSAQSLQSNLTFDGGNSQYCAATTERQQLIDNFNWTITDGGYDFSCDPSAHFITTWKTDNPGSSGDQTISIPVDPGNTYYYSIDWGDGAEEHELTGTASHTYASPGTYTVKIQGLYPRIYFFNSGDREKLLTVSQWGSQSWISMESAFKNCNNLTIPATDAPDLSGVSNMDEMFENCSSFNNNISNWDVSNVSLMNKLFQNATNFNHPLNSWDVSNVTEMSFLFNGASSFNQPLNSWNVGNVIYMLATFANATSFDQPLGNWNVSHVEVMGPIFDQVTLSTVNYDDLLIGWGAQSLQSNIVFNAGFSTYCVGEQARQDMISNYGWTFSDGGKDCLTDHFVTSWKTDNPGSSSSTSITIPTYIGETYNYDVDWNNDGIFDQLDVTGNITHDFGATGTYTIRIRGTFPRIYFNVAGDRQKIIAVDQWGTQVWTSMESAFRQCYYLTIPATDAPDLSQLISTRSMFNQCFSFNESINHWDVSNVTNLSNMFNDCSSFNQALDLWDVSNVLDVSFLFSGCSDFNQDLSNWDVGNVTVMNNMFSYCDSFNQDIGNWNTSNVQYIHSMFQDCSAFNQNIGNWDVSNLILASNMFKGAKLSVVNYDNLLIGWNTLEAGETQIPVGLTFDGGNSHYCLASNERMGLTSTYAWTISDAGSKCCSTSTTFSSAGWDNGLPSAAVNVVISDDYHTSLNGGSLDACNITISSGATLTIDNGHFLKYSSQLLIEGNVILKLLGIIDGGQNGG
jgi:surface protein